MEANNIWIIGVVALAIGLLIGYLLGRAGKGDDSALQQQLDQARQELDAYRLQVAGHFAETAQLVNRMTESYRDVYAKLATGAQVLCDAETARQVEATMLPQPTHTDIEEQPVAAATEAEDTLQPPLDYAPKRADEAGTLSESYGLDDQPDDDEPPRSAAVKSSPEKTA